jgi:hypothetical protein
VELAWRGLLRNEKKKTVGGALFSRGDGNQKNARARRKTHRPTVDKGKTNSTNKMQNLIFFIGNQQSYTRFLDVIIIPSSFNY